MFDDRVHVIVVGCGRVGAELALELVEAGHDVALVDKDARAFRRLPASWGGRNIVGFGFDRDTLEEADVAQAGALAAVTSGDNSNILTARIAREVYSIPQVVARIYDPRRALVYQRLGIPTVATVTWTVDQAMRRLFPDRPLSEATEWADPTGSVLLVERLAPARLAGRAVAELETVGDVRVVAVTRAGRARLAHRELLAQEGDVLLVAVAKSALPALEAHLAELTGAVPRSAPG